MDIKEFGEKYIIAQNEAWQNGNFDALEALEIPDVIFHLSPVGDMVGWEGHKQYILLNRQNYTDFHQDFTYLVGEGNLFALSYKSRGTAITEVPALNIAKGNKLSTDYIFVLQIKNEKVTEVWANGSINISD